MLSIFNLHNMNASDEVTEALVFVTVKMVLHEMGVDISNEHIALGCPSQRHIGRWEKKLAVECILCGVHEMKADLAKWLAILCDHGKRNGIEH